MDGIALSFDKKAIDIIVDKAMEFKLGARGLRSICEAIMLDAMFEFPSDESKKDLKITAAYIKTQLTKLSFTKLKVAQFTTIGYVAPFIVISKLQSHNESP